MALVFRFARLRLLNHPKLNSTGAIGQQESNANQLLRKG
jgi:hypothetical protein